MPGDELGTLKSYIAPPPPKGWERLGTPIAPSSGTIRAPKKVRERHKMVVFLHCAGWRNNEIARAMGYTESRVSVILSSTHPELSALRERAQTQVRDTSLDLMLRFRQEANASLTTLIEVRDQTEDVGQRRLAARDILDRAGYSVVKKAINLNADIPVQQLEGVVDKLAEAHEVETLAGQWTVRNPGDKKDAA